MEKSLCWSAPCQCYMGLSGGAGHAKVRQKQSVGEKHREELSRSRGWRRYWGCTVLQEQDINRACCDEGEKKEIAYITSI